MEGRDGRSFNSALCSTHTVLWVKTIPHDAMSELHKSYPLKTPLVEEEVLCWFRFYEGYKGSEMEPSEPPYVDLLDVRADIGVFNTRSVSILRDLSPDSIKLIEGMLLEEMLINGE